MPKTAKNEFNYGLALLRMLMCFEVVLCHCWTETEFSKLLLPFDFLRQTAVLVFMFMSFYLSEKYFVKKDSKVAFKRIHNLFVPQVFWALVYFIIYFIAGLITKVKIVNGIQDLFWQIFTGHSPQLNESMWFQTDLIIISILFFLIFHFFNEKVGTYIIAALGIICIVLQYSQINYDLFGEMRYELKFPLGRLAETIPFAVLGFISSRYDLLSLFKKRWLNLITATIFIFASFVFSHYNLFSTNSGFGYSGICKIIFGFAVTMFAYNCNFDFMAKKSKFILFISQYTLGIYCAHRLISRFLYFFLEKIGMQSGMFYQCIIIYIIGFVLFFAINKLPIKWLKYVI